MLRADFLFASLFLHRIPRGGRGKTSIGMEFFSFARRKESARTLHAPDSKSNKLKRQ